MGVSGMVLFGAAALVGGSIVVPTALYTMLKSPTPSAETLQTPASARKAAIDLGLSPTVLAACGCVAADAQSLLTAVEAESAKISALFAARDEVSRLMVDVQRAERADVASTEAREHLATLRDSLGSARTALSSARQALYMVVVQELGEQVRLRLSIWENNSASGLPSDLRVISWADEERRSLVSALAAERKAASSKSSLDQESSSVLESARSRPEAVAARSSIESNLNAIKAAFESE